MFKVKLARDYMPAHDQLIQISETYQESPSIALNQHHWETHANGLY